MKNTPIRAYIISIFLIPTFWIFMDYQGWLKYPENLLVNWRFNVRGELESPAPIFYVDVDTEVVAFMGERPFPRSYYADAIEALHKYGNVGVVGVDIVFSDSTYSDLVDESRVDADTAAFRKILEAYPNTVLAAAYTPRDNVITEKEGDKVLFPYLHLGFDNPDENPLPEQPGMELIGISGGSLGLINVADHYSPGPTPRWVPLFAETPGPTYFTLALEMIRKFNGLDKEDLVIKKDNLVVHDQEGGVLHSIPMTDNQLLEINWHSAWMSPTNPRVSMLDVLIAKARLEAGTAEQVEEAFTFFQQFEGAYILIGPVDPLMQDLAPAPFQGYVVPRVGVHGNLLKTMLAGRDLVRFPQYVTWIITLLLTIGTTLAFIFNVDAYYRITSMSGLLIYLLIALVSFIFVDWVLPMITPLSSTITASLVVIAYQLIYTERQRGKIKGLFGTYVSPELVDRMVESDVPPSLGGSEETISAFFSDIEGFTSISESLEPQPLIQVMNEYLSAMTDIIQEERGTLDKYIGDAIVAMYGAPVPYQDHALAACNSAALILEKQMQLCETWIRQKGKWNDKIHDMRTRIGVNTGIATIGNMGSATRFNYTMLGDNVNLAARCESGAKQYGVYCMITQATVEAISTFDHDLLIRQIDRIIVKGKTEPVNVFELAGFKSSMPAQTLECHQRFNQGFQAYIAQEWDNARANFQQALALESHSPFYRADAKTYPSQVMLTRVNEMQAADLPQDWDGTYVLTSK